LLESGIGNRRESRTCPRFRKRAKPAPSIPKLLISIAFASFPLTKRQLPRLGEIDHVEKRLSFERNLIGHRFLCGIFRSLALFGIRNFDRTDRIERRPKIAGRIRESRTGDGWIRLRIPLSYLISSYGWSRDPYHWDSVEIGGIYFGIEIWGKGVMVAEIRDYRAYSAATTARGFDEAR